MDPLRGKLLVATPAIEGGVFHRSVVYLLDHDGDGALGVVVNRPLDADVEDVLPGWADVVNAPVCLFEGGPVATDSALAVGVLAAAVATDGDPAVPPGWRTMAGRVGLVDLDEPVPAQGLLAGVRVFAGYAGWAPEQLEGELTEGAWLVVDATERDLLSAQPETLWQDVLRRQDDELRFWATFPDDPASN